MSTADKIADELRQLPPEEQSEVLDFVEFLKHRKGRKQEKQFASFSLTNAMRGIAEEPELYTTDDIREPIT